MCVGVIRGVCLTSILNCPVFIRNNKSFRQCPILDTMIRTFIFCATGRKSYVMSYSAASCANGGPRWSVDGDGDGDDDVSACFGPKCTRIKKRRDVGSLNCWRSRTLWPCEAKMPVTAWMMPGLSGQDRVRMWSFAVGIVIVAVGGLGETVWL